MVSLLGIWNRRANLWRPFCHQNSWICTRCGNHLVPSRPDSDEWCRIPQKIPSKPAVRRLQSLSPLLPGPSRQGICGTRRHLKSWQAARRGGGGKEAARWVWQLRYLTNWGTEEGQQIDLFPGLFRVSVNPSLFCMVNPFLSITFPQKHFKKLVFSTLKISSFHFTFPAAIAFSPPLHTESFPEIYLSLQSPYAPLLLTAQFTSLCLPPPSQV